MENIYRVLDTYEEMHYLANNKIYSNSDFEGLFYVFGYDKYGLDENLDNIISHIQHGNMTCSKWISCSKSLIIDLEKYSDSKLFYKKYKRPNIALVKNYSENSLIIDDIDIFAELKKCNFHPDFVKYINYIRNLPISKVKKLVVDLNDTNFLYNLCKLDFIKTKSGKIPNLDSRAFNYARASEEVLVLSKIESEYSQSNGIKNLNLNKEGIPCLLKPLVYDVLYTLIKNKSISENFSDRTLYSLIKVINEFPINTLDKLELSFYQSHYSCNYTLYYLIDIYNTQKLDVLALYMELLKLKRAVLSKIIDWINLNLSENYNKDIYLIDDQSYVIRSNGNYQKVDVQLIDNNFMKVAPIENQSIGGLYLSELGISNINSIYQYGQNEDYYTLINGKIYRIYLDKLEQNKKYIKNIINN